MLSCVGKQHLPLGCLRSHKRFVNQFHTACYLFVIFLFDLLTGKEMLLGGINGNMVCFCIYLYHSKLQWDGRLVTLWRLLTWSSYLIYLCLIGDLSSHVNYSGYCFISQVKTIIFHLCLFLTFLSFDVAL